VKERFKANRHFSRNKQSTPGTGSGEESGTIGNRANKNREAQPPMPVERMLEECVEAKCVAVALSDAKGRSLNPIFWNAE